MVSKIQGFFYYQKIRTGSMGHRLVFLQTSQNNSDILWHHT